MKTGCLIFRKIFNCIFITVFKVHHYLLYSNKSVGAELRKRDASPTLTVPEMESKRIFTDFSVDSTSVKHIRCPKVSLLDS